MKPVPIESAVSTKINILHSMKVLAFLFYGNKKEYQWELFLSIFSALKQLRANHETDVIISVISDRDDFDPQLPIDHLKISSEELTQWTQSPAGFYNHRAKICALLKALDHYQSPVVYVDTDTYFLDNPAKLFERVSAENTLMHHLEYSRIENEPIYPPIIEKIGQGVTLDGIYLSRASVMFNSGVIGLLPLHRPLIEKALNLTDELYQIAPIFNLEQFSISVALNHYTKVSTSEDIINHYFGPSRYFFHLQSSRLFPDFTAATLEKLLNAPTLPEVGYPQKSLIDQVITKAQASIKGWDDEYRFAYLSYRSALSIASKDIGYANIWAAIALNSLKQSFKDSMIQDATPQNLMHRLAALQHDFKKFRPDKINDLDWLEATAKRDWLNFWNQTMTITSEAVPSKLQTRTF